LSCRDRVRDEGLGVGWGGLRSFCGAAGIGWSQAAGAVGLMSGPGTVGARIVVAGEFDPGFADVEPAGSGHGLGKTGTGQIIDIRFAGELDPVGDGAEFAVGVFPDKEQVATDLGTGAAQGQGHLANLAGIAEAFGHRDERFGFGLGGHGGNPGGSRRPQPGGGGPQGRGRKSGKNRRLPGPDETGRGGGETGLGAHGQ